MYFSLFSNCKIVKGASNSIIIDLQRKDVYIIDNFFYDILENYQDKTVDEILKTHPFEKKGDILEFFAFLRKNELIFESVQKISFKNLNEDWYYPFLISNGIIDYGHSEQLYDSVTYLNSIQCQFLQIRFFNNIDLLELQKVLNQIDNSYNVISVELIFSNIEDICIDIIKQSHKTVIVYIFNNDRDYIEEINQITFVFSQKQINSELCCGNISMSNFNINIKNFTESIHHNSCLNRKLAIDRDGNIKNCPSMPQNFGNIKDTTLEEVLNHKDVKKYWNLTKDEIEVCKDCEFRYICTDCRAYTERTHANEQGLDTSKPLKCGYNPYTGEWEEWSKNPLKEKAIQYYGMQNLTK